jgi:hypothetical protein
MTATAAVVILVGIVLAWQTVTDDSAPGRGRDASLAGSGAPVRPPTADAPDGAHGTTDTLSELAKVADLANRATEEIGILAESTVTEPHWAYLDQNAKQTLEALNNHVPLDAVASLLFADASTDWPWESPDR